MMMSLEDPQAEEGKGKYETITTLLKKKKKKMGLHKSNICTKRMLEEGRMDTVSCRVRDERTGGAKNGSQHKGVRNGQAGSFQWRKGRPERSWGSRADKESR